MTNVWIRQVRRKAVWGPKRTVGALCLLLVAGLAASPADAKTHSSQAPKKQAGAPGAFVKNYKIDDALTDAADHANPNLTTRVIVTLVPARTLPYDDNGHGTHVAGIIGGNGYDSLTEKQGMAPGASLVSLKVLDANGLGTISNIISALGWIATNAKTYNIRVVNMSVGANIKESYWTDPLTLATKKLTDQGVVVVCAAGNMGKNAAGSLQYGGITAPGNAPWVLTVGASSHMGTDDRGDDTIAPFSSRGPTVFDYGAKPDIVAPGVGIESLSDPNSAFYSSKSRYLLSG